LLKLTALASSILRIAILVGIGYLLMKVSVSNPENCALVLLKIREPEAERTV
jgi:hypothetical protein